jgi:hypothetical protein
MVPHMRADPQLLLINMIFIAMAGRFQGAAINACIIHQ